MRTRLSRAPLSTRLLAITLTLLIALSAVVGATSIALLRHTLIDRVDEQVRAGMPHNFFARPANPPLNLLPLPETNSGNAVNQQPHRIGQLTATLSNGVLSEGMYFNDNGTQQSLSSTAQAELVAMPRDGVIRTLDLAGLGSFRVVATVVGTDTVTISAVSLAATNQTINTLILIFVLVALAALIIAAIIGRAVITSSLAPLTTIAATAKRIATKPLASGDVDLSDRVPVASPDTEIGQVGTAINTMLGHIESALLQRHASEDKLRRFVADASHELRSPLATVRGYSELALQRADTLPEEHRQAIARINSESIRMSALVSDLLLLARLDAGQEIRHETIDLTPLLVTAVQDAHAAGPDHEWGLELPDEPMIITGDPAALHQVLTNVLANARAHTPAGTRVQAGLALSANGESAVITIADNGPGIEPELRASLFERFTRADASRNRDTGSSGLGLAIASAILGAHHGTLLLDETHAPGAAFVITLPLATGAQDGAA